MVYSAKMIAKAFLAFCAEYGDWLTNLKLQKLLYYAQGWHLALYDEPLFAEPLEAWIHGPVVPDVYREYRDFGHGPIPMDSLPALNTFDPHLIEHVTDVWEAYGRFTAYDLERMSHQETPWIKARHGLAPDVASDATLDLQEMRRFFKSQQERNDD